MTARPVQLLVAVMGLLLVAGLALARRDRSGGPAWKRRLVAAGLGLLASLGFGDAVAAEPRQAGQQAEGALDARPEWKRLQALAQEAEAVHSGARGDYPFDEKGKKRLDAAFASASGDLDALVAAGLLDRAEADLLAKRLDDLHSGIGRFRTVEMKEATCYEPMPPRFPAQESADRLRERVPILRKLAAAQALHPPRPREAARVRRAGSAAARARPEPSPGSEEGTGRRRRRDRQAQGAALGALRLSLCPIA